MESQNTEQLTQEHHNEVSENLELAEAIVVNENHDTPENSSIEPNLDELNNGTVAQQIAGLPNQLNQKTLCWSDALQKWVDCPPRP